MTGAPADQAARTTIETELDRTLFVEAGAGSGKTTALVGRIVALVLDGHVRLSQIAAITFTEAAASELRSRVRETLEVRERELNAQLNPDAEQLARCRAALDEVDAAAISTLHSFAQRILSEHPVAVGIPPRVEVLDEVQSLLEFERRWGAFLDELLERPDLAELLLRALLLGINFNDRRRGLRSVAVVFNENWDRLEAMAAEQPELIPLRWDPLLEHMEPLLTLRDRCTDADDKLAQRLERDIEPAVRRVRDATSDDERLRLLTLWPASRASKGRKDNWDDVDEARAAINEVTDEVGRFLGAAADGVLRALATEVARFTRAAADERRAEGRLEFHDLLVLARDLLRSDAEARRALHDRYRRLLLDEFQDTDPIQLELAALIARRPSDEPPPVSWADIDAEEGRLFFVGDPKQSIYRFRRASIETFVAARQAFAGGQPVTLSENFRTVEPIVDFVNGLFGDLIQAHDHAQPAFEPLTAHRPAVVGIDQRPTVFGGPHPDDDTAHDLRVSEANDVAAAIAQIMDRRSRWLVHRGDERAPDQPEWDLPNLSDIVILVPTRTSLPVLGQALDDHHVPYRADTGSLVFDSQEVRDVISALRAVDDPSDEVSLVAALRSPLYGCGDDDLARWRRDGGQWDYRLEAPASAPADDPVRLALDDLHDRHRQRWWVEPSALIQSIVDDRRSMLLALDQARPRDVWRRVRYLQDQARAFSEAGGGDLRRFLDWVALQGADGARTHEPILAEPDDDAVRIMTVHASKGLEFPIVVVSGLTTQRRGATRDWVLFDGDSAELKLSRKATTEHFDRRADLEAEMDEFEKTRLLYVACTRARDHLLVSAHHTPKKSSHGRDVWSWAEGELGRRCRPFEAPVVEPGPPPFEATLPALDDTAGARAEWAKHRAQALADQTRPAAVSATTIARDAAGRLRLDETDGDASLDVGHRRGRAGTAIGRAVHAVLQEVDLTDPTAVEALARSQAHIESVPWAAGEIAAAARHALEAPLVVEAARRRSWRELYVGATVGSTVVEGYVDLLVETGDGLVVVDYKTDAVPTDADLDAALARYRGQAAAYALAVAATTGRPVAEAVFVFCGPDGFVQRSVDDLDLAVADVEAALA